MSANIREKLEKYDRDNRIAARIILADPERYAGLPLIWARMWTENHKEKRNG